MRHLVLFLVVLTVPLVGQTTWGGLRFGMTEAQVKVAMKGQVETTGDPPGTQSYWPFRIKSVKVGPATGTATLGFALKKKTLQLVSLDLSHYNERDAFADISTDETSSRIVAYEYVSKQLLEKYGKPVDETGYCPTSSEAINHFVSGKFPFPYRRVQITFGHIFGALTMTRLCLYVALHHRLDPHPKWRENKWSDDNCIRQITTDPETADLCRHAEIIYIHRCGWKPEGKTRIPQITSCSVRVAAINGPPDRPTVHFKDAVLVGKPVGKRLYGIEKPHYYAPCPK